MTTKYGKVRKGRPRGVEELAPFSYNPLPVVLSSRNFAHRFVYTVINYSMEVV